MPPQVSITLYRFTDKLGPLTVPSRLGEQSDLTIATVTKATKALGEQHFNFTIKSWFSHFLLPLTKGGWHPPVLLINGRVFSQGVVPNFDDLKSYLNHQVNAHQETEFSQISDMIYLGQNMCCTFHSKKLTDLGITADIDLELEQTHNIPNLPVYLRLPVPDHQPPSLIQLKSGVALLQHLIKQKQKVYIHCLNGHGRSPTLLAAYFISQGKTINQAIKLIKAKRPTIHPEKSQIKQLEKYAQRS